MAAIQKDIEKRLRIDPRDIHLKFKSLEGTRHIIQYENPEYVFTLSKTFKPKIKAYGVTNRCEDGKFVLFLEYDKVYKSLVYKNLKNLIKTFPDKFNNFYIARTEPEEHLEDGNIKGSYHVVNFNKHYKYQIERMIRLCDVDPFFKKIPQKTTHKCHVLRFSEKYWKIDGRVAKQKPEFIETYPFKEMIKSQGQASYAHYWLFRKEWNIIDPFYTYHKFDGLKALELHRYSTPKKVD